MRHRLPFPLLLTLLLRLNAGVTREAESEQFFGVVGDCDLATAAEERRPCVFRRKDLYGDTSTPTILDDATAYLLRRLPETVEAGIGPLNSTAFYFSPSAPLATASGVQFRPKHSWGRLPLTDILQPPVAAGERRGEKYYCSVPLKNLPDQVSSDIDELLAPFSLQQQQQQQQQHGGLWMTSRGVAAASHFDSSANVILQLAGTKLVAVASPLAWRDLSTFSAL